MTAHVHPIGDVMKYNEMRSSLRALRLHALTEYALWRFPALLTYGAMFGAVTALRGADVYHGILVWQVAVLLLATGAVGSVASQLAIVAGKQGRFVVLLSDVENPLVAMLSLVFAGHGVYLAMVDLPGLGSLNLLVAALLTWRLARPSPTPRLRR